MAADATIQWQATGVDGKSTKLTSVSIDAEGKLSSADVADSVRLDDLSSITVIGAKISPIKPNIVAELPAGGRLFANEVSIADEELTFRMAGGDVVLPIDAVRAVRMAPAGVHEPFDEALANPSAEFDTIFFRGEDRNIVSAVGLTESFTQEKLTFDWSGKTRMIDRDLLWGIVLAGSPGTASVPPATVVMRDGASLPGTILAADDSNVTLAIGGSKTKLPWSLIARIDVRSSRVTLLSDLEPVEQVQTPLVTAPLPSRKDLNVQGMPLRLGTTTYAKGWGTHAQARLVFDLPEDYEWLLGTVGHDPATRGKGDCVIVVQGDGQELFSTRLRASEPPVDLRVSMRGIRKVTLLVEPGEDLDLADHVNWCDLRLLRQSNERP